MPRRSASARKTKPRKGQQLELPRTNWGGKRRGAGRKPGPGGKKGAPHKRRPWHDRRHPVHVSLKVDPDEIDSLRRPDLAGAIVECLREVREKHAAKKDFRVVHYSIQDSHLHLVLEARDRQALTRGMQGLAIRVARRINKVLGRRGKVFVDRYFEVPLTSPRQTRNGLAYVLLNKRRHRYQQGQSILCESGWIDPRTSGHYFDGWSGLRTRPPPGDRPPVSRPRTWMLRVGWRRHGRIHPDEVPGSDMRAATSGCRGKPRLPTGARR